MRTALFAAAAVLSAVNIALFVLWWSLIKVETDQPDRDSEYIFNALSVQITVLEVVLAAIGIALAILGFVGYQGVKDAAVEKALMATRTQVQDHLNKLKPQDGMDVSQPHTGPVAEIEASDVKSEEPI